ncbi:hypothetical protein SASPL_113954 [Salvia splendens]|uniref:ATP-dependent Clp protease proteolytic subunit n=2 Tax=Salvia splendens TaxID=180675 RepID=A0A8X9A1J9_SALSN|nr:hypothetical protein SASPL_113954 [Salvia splendens]
MASILFPTTRMRLNTTLSLPSPPQPPPSFQRPSPPTTFLSPFVGGSVSGDFSGLRIRPASLIDNSSNSTSRVKRGVVTVLAMPYRYVKPPIFTLCVGNAWGEAALLLAAGAKGNRSALPSSTIMIKQPIARFQGQATDVELMRKEVRNVKAELVKLYAKHVGKSPEEIEEDIRRPKYFSPIEAVEYGIIDKVLYNERSNEDRGVLSDLKKAQLI